jgi:hypothetical protein
MNMLQEAIARDEDEPVQARCLNCGAALGGRHCHACGQKAQVHHTLGAFLHDLVHGVLHFEGKMWRTLPLLAWRPGELTRRYIEGERARFVSPIAAFLFSVFLMFAAFGIIGGPIKSSAYEVRIGGEYLRYMPTLESAEKKLQQDLDQWVAQRARLIEQRAPAERIARADHIIATLTAAIQRVEQGASEAPPPPAPPASITRQNRTLDLGMIFRPSFEKIGRNPPLIINEVQNKAYKFSWALIPMSVPFLLLLMLGNARNRIFEHTVFITYSLSFVTLLLVVLTLSRPLGFIDTLAPAFPFLVAWHMYRQLRGAYRLSWPGALWRTALLLFFALLASTMFVLMLVAVA